MKKIFSLLMMALLPMLASAATGNDKLKFADITAEAGGEATLAIEMDNEDGIIALETHFKFPDGVSVDMDKLTDYNSQYNSGKLPEDLINRNRCSDHQISFNATYNHTYVLSMNNTVINGNSGSLFYLPLKIDNSLENGVYDITLTQIQLSPADRSGAINLGDYTGKLIIQAPVTNSITATDITARPGKTFTLPLNLENTDEIIEAEFKLALPEGVTLESAKVTSRGNGHEVDYKLRAGKYNFEVFSEKGNAFSGTDGAFVELTLKADAGIAAGDYDIQVSDISLITADDKEVTVADFTAKLTIEEPTATITAGSLAAKAGKSIVLPINLENDNEITDIEFKLTLPAEVTLEGAAVTDRGTDQEVSYKLRSGGYKFEVTSPAGLPFSGTEGAAVNITLKTDKTTAAGDYDILVSDILLVTKEGKEISVKDFTVKLSLTEWKEITVEDITKLIDEYLEQ